MKKIGVIFSTILLMLGMVGCAGAGDYEIELINGFKVRRTSAEKVHIASPEYSYDELLIPLLADYDEGEYVTQVGHDNDRYIIAKTNLNNYYLLDTKEPIVYGPFTEEKFMQVKENVKIPESVTLKNLDKYKKIK
ncbi:MAG: DUF3997 domain-containing protein [Romboutsia timonensis]|uniref:DUF3997 domain-containing protein n=1 Tax=Romboutsia timonensis TaxID=1776391 RepID=UPI002A754C6C|nr:DUF3997 domain-containing protein [Romboutsia timonensis]MCI6668631.1 DUF3997 domain-containing protein [Romboutsia timonensis]MDY2881740.1 DUF3997 domain-containing protein [Romboutsia timonensis]